MQKTKISKTLRMSDHRRWLRLH